MMMNAADDADDEPRIPNLRLSQEASRPSENWDDDFEFHPRVTDDERRHGQYDATHAPEQPVRSHDHEESWDDAYEDDDPDASPVKRAPNEPDDDVEDWDSSDNEAHDEHKPARVRNPHQDHLRELGAGFEEEDKTVTARSSSSRARPQPPALPIPSFPSEGVQISQPPPLSFPFHNAQSSTQHPLPTSPTLSSFSIPISSHRASIYSQDPLMPTTSNSSAPHLSLPVMRAYPQSAGSTPPRKGRRLRKKSRPPEADIFELEDREPDPTPSHLPEVPLTPPAPPSPPRPVTPPPTVTPITQPTPSPSLLTRIGSLKRWARRSVGPDDPAVSGFRRGKSSAGPSEISRAGKSSTGPEELDESLEHEIRAVSPTPVSSGRSRLRRSRGESTSGQKAGWFFRAGGGGGAEREEEAAASPAPTAAPARTPEPSPAKRGGLRMREKEKEAEGSATPTPKKVRGRLVPVLRTSGSAFQSQKQTQIPTPASPRSSAKASRERAQFPRHNGSASVGRSAGTLMMSGIEQTEVKEGGGVRGLMNGVRRLSLVNSGHKRTKSTGGDGAVEVPGRNTAARADSGRPTSRTDDHPGLSARPASRASTTGTGPRIGADKELLPPIELDSPSPRRQSLPWAEHDAANAYKSPAAEPLTVLSLPPPSTFSLPMQRQSFSASATSLLTSSPTKSQQQSQSPFTPQRPSASGVANVSQPPASPRTGSASASLGRSTASPVHAAGPALRRNSLGDLKLQTPPRGELKIPARISRAQQGLRRDLSMVRDFAASVEHLKRLQGTYASLIRELRAVYDASPVSPSSRPISPGQVQFHLPSRPSSQAAKVHPSPSLQNMSSPSTTQLVSPRASQDVSRELVRLDTEYGIWWECAELLVELGGGSVAGAGTASNPNLAALSSTTLNTPAGEPQELDGPEGLHVTSISEPRSVFEQALVEAKGPPQASPPQWRASTGRHDLSARQLRLLKDMLNTPDPASLADAAGPYGYGAGYPPSHVYPAAQEGEVWAPWNPSTVTLPSEESSTDPHTRGLDEGKETEKKEKEKKRRASRLGMLGLRELLRGLKRNAVAEGRLDGTYPAVQGSESSVSGSNSADDDHYNRRRSPWHHHDEHHGGKRTPAPEDAPTLEVLPIRSVPPKSPRRPSLASIFRIGQKSSKNGGGRNKEQPSNGNSTTEEEQEGAGAGGALGEYSDWDRMSRSDLDLPTTVLGSGMATVRGKKPPLPNPNLLQSHSLPTVNMSIVNRVPNASQTSLRDTTPSSGTPPQSSKLPLSIAEEGSVAHQQDYQGVGNGRLKKGRTPSWSQAHPSRPTSRTGKAAMSGTVRSAPPTDLSSMPNPQLVLTPENIKPLLEYSKEVSMRLGECIGEVQVLLGKAA